MRDTLKDLIGPVLIALVFIALAGGLIISVVNDEARSDRLKRECLERGGRVVEIHRSNGWFCEELQPR